MLQNFQRNRFRLWSVYNLGMGGAGDLSFSGLWRVEGAASLQHGDSKPGHHSYAGRHPDGGGLSGRPGAEPHLLSSPSAVTDDFQVMGCWTCLSTTTFRCFVSLRPWIKLDLYNALNNTEADRAGTRRLPQNPAAGVDNLGLATGYTKGSSYGRASGNTVSNYNLTAINAFPVAFNQGEAGAVRGGRTFRMALGFRF